MLSLSAKCLAAFVFTTLSLPLSKNSVGMLNAENSLEAEEIPLSIAQKAEGVIQECTRGSLL